MTLFVAVHVAPIGGIGLPAPRALAPWVSNGNYIAPRHANALTICAMPKRMPLLLSIAVVPLALLAGLIGASLIGSRPALARGHVMRVELPPVDRVLDLPEVGGERAWPLVVIDPGHGGHDPGASGQGYTEKRLVLDLARALRDELLAQGGVRVALTREEDKYLLHAERYALARRLGADLFLSIHADSAGEASEVTGASVYTLSNEASSQAAARFAARENSSDRLNGVDLAAQSDAVSTILVELSQRRVQRQADELARLILREGEGVLVFHPQPRRAAALAVLRAPDVPSVLYESGFITNESDARRLASEAGRERFATVMARAIRIYFARQSES